LAYVDFDGAQALEAAGPDTELNADWIKRVCPNVFEGINRLCHWISR
jgi:hypothetical protein